MDPIFVKVRNDEGVTYDSYVDYWKMVELWGFRTCELGEIDFESDSVYIYSPPNGNTSFPKKRNCSIIQWHFERPTWPEFSCSNPEDTDEIWVSCHGFAGLAREKYGSSRFRWVFVGGHPDFGVSPEEKRSYTPTGDVVFLSYVSGPRQSFVGACIDNGLSIAVDHWGEDRERVLKGGRFGAAIHQDHAPIIEPLRYMLYASYCLPIFANVCLDVFPYKVFDYRRLFDNQPTQEEIDVVVHHNKKMVLEKGFGTMARLATKLFLTKRAAERA